MEKTGFQQFIKLCTQAQSEQQLEALLKAFLTPDEQMQLANRVLLIQALLDRKKTQREIAAELKISIAKITRGSNLLKTLNQSLRRYLKKALLTPDQ